MKVKDLPIQIDRLVLIQKNNSEGEELFEGFWVNLTRRCEDMEIKSISTCKRKYVENTYILIYVR